MYSMQMNHEIRIELIPISEVSELLKISKETARKMAKNGLFGCPVYVGSGKTRKHLRVQKSGFQKYCLQNGIKKTDFGLIQSNFF